MKKIMALVAVCAVAGSACADLAQFYWKTSTKTDGVVSGDVVNTFIGSSLYDSLQLLTSGNEILLSDYNAFVLSAFDSQSAIIGTGPNAGKWNTTILEGSGADVIGQMAFAVVDDGVVEIGDTIKFYSLVGSISDLQPGGSGTTVSPTQVLDPGSFTSVQVIPEPATIGMMGVAGLGLFLARKKNRRED